MPAELSNSGHHTPEYQEARARALLTVGGMLVTQVARAMAFDYPGQGWDYRRARRLAERIRRHGENGSVAA